MIRPYKHPLYIQVFPGYELKLRSIHNKLGTYRVDARIDWRHRTEAWLSNFEGLHDQRLAFGMLERLRLVSEGEVVEGCRSLLERIRVTLPRKTRILHFAHETSGGLLVRILEKDLNVRSYAVLRPSDFAKLGALSKLRDGDAIVVWDRFNGTGRQLSTLIKMYTKAFAESKKELGPLHCAYIAGHALKKALPGIAVLHRWIEEISMVTPEEAELCARYADAAGKTGTNQKHETGALLTFSDNPPNNVPLVLRAKASETWFTLLDRKETAKP